MDEQRRTRALGVVSLGLGIPAVVAPGLLANVIGVGDGPQSRRILRLIGVREIACGVGLLIQRWPVGWVWARVAGDAMDLSLTTAALASDTPGMRRGRLLGAGAALLGITAADLSTGLALSRRARTDHALEARRAITVLRSPEDVYSVWRDFTQLPRFMDHLASVESLGGNRSHWKATAPAGKTVEWDAEIVEDQPNRLIAWRSLPGASVPNGGTVHFTPAPGGRGTEIHVELRYDPPAGRLGALAAALFGENPTQQVAGDLRRFKQILETGEMTRSDASAKGGGSAQPPAEAAPTAMTLPPEPARR